MYDCFILFEIISLHPQFKFAAPWLGTSAVYSNNNGIVNFMVFIEVCVLERKLASTHNIVRICVKSQFPSKILNVRIFRTEFT